MGDTMTAGLRGLKDVAIGSDHKLLLTTDGQVLAAGQGRKGQLGLGAKVMETNDFKPLESLSGKKVKAVACGSVHSAAVTENG